MEWVPVLTALITAVATLGGVAITQAYASARESKLDQWRREDEATVDLRTEARRVSDLFAEEGIAYERIRNEAREADEDDFEKRYEDHLYAESLRRLGQAIAMIPDAEARAQLRMVVANLADQKHFPEEFGVPIYFLVVPILLNLGSEISSAYARGERPDLDKMHRYRQVEAASRSLDAKVAKSLAEAEERIRKMPDLEGKIVVHEYRSENSV
jgi:hypothetical protein